MVDIKRALRQSGGFYLVAKHAIRELLKPPSSQAQAATATHTLASARALNFHHHLAIKDPDFERELEAMETQKRAAQADEDAKLAFDLNEKEAVDSGAAIECGCCCADVAFENMYVDVSRVSCCVLQPCHLFRLRPCAPHHVDSLTRYVSLSPMDSVLHHTSTHTHTHTRNHTPATAHTHPRWKC